MIRAIVFDMDDTLYEEKEYVISGFKSVDKWVKEKYEISGFIEIASELFFLGERKQTFNKTLELLNIVYDNNSLSKMIEIYRSHEPEIQLLKETEWVINNLMDTVKLGLISDGYIISQRKKVEALKLNHKFHSIILSDQYGRENWKPSSLPYEKVSMELQCNHDECVYIGDNVHKDFVTAKKLGWSTVHISRKDGIYYNAEVPSDYKADFQVRNLKELSSLPILKHLFLNHQPIGGNLKNEKQYN